MNKFFLLLISAVSFSSNVSLYAQIDLHNTGILHVSSSGDILFVNGNFTNINTATLTNNGNLYVKQDITNNQASMSVGTGSLYLNGTSGQSVNGTQGFKTYNFVSDNTSGITLNNNLSVSGVHTFTNGLIASSVTPNYLIYEAGSSYTGATDATHVTGWVKKIGTTNFSFPVGDATYLRSAGIINLSAMAEFNCHYFRPTANIFNLTAPLVQVNSREYWQIDEISGSNAQVILNWDNSKVAFDNVLISEIRVGVYTGGTWKSAGGYAAGNISTTGTVVSNIGNALAGPMTFGYGVDMLLPLRIIHFTTERRTGISFIKWTTADEKDINYFEIQRSNDGVNFTAISNTRARNSGQQENYVYEDRSLLQGVAYYRIKSVDIAGKIIYTNIAAVSETNLSTNLFTIINPAKNVITIFNKSRAEGVFQYRLMNMTGQVVTKGNVSITINGIGVIPVSEKAAAGIYILELNNSQIQFKQKVVIEK